MKRLILAVSMLALSLSGVRAVALTIEITKGADGGILLPWSLLSGRAKLHCRWMLVTS